MMLLMRTSSGETNIGIGNLDVYRPTIDPVALLAIAAVTTAVGVVAAFVPRRRAARMNPNVAPRHVAQRIRSISSREKGIVGGCVGGRC